MATAADTIRTFVAIEMPASVIDALRGLQRAIREDGLNAKWVRPELIHLTLKFLGDVNAADVDRIGQRIAAAVLDICPIQLVAQGIGVFPNIRRARVLWTGTGGETDILGHLQQRIEQELETVGFKAYGRRFAAHLTLARFKDMPDPDTLIAVMKQHGEFRSDTFLTDAVHLYQSELTRNGPVYTKLEKFQLRRPH